jgi:hypothetical protein
MLVQVPCQTRIWGELGICCTNWEDLPQRVERIAPAGGANRPSGWSESPVAASPSGQPSATRSASSACSGDYRPRSPRTRPTALKDFAMVCGHPVAYSASPSVTAKYSGMGVKASSPGSRQTASPAGLAGRQEAGW